MREFHAEAGRALEEQPAAAAFEALLDKPRLGRVWLLEQQPDATAGYVVVTFVFAMEYGGEIAVIDDFFVRPVARGEGLGTAALAEVRRACADLGMLALRVEVGADNAAARAVYHSAGLSDVDHQLLALRLDQSEEGGR